MKKSLLLTLLSLLLIYSCKKSFDPIDPLTDENQTYSIQDAKNFLASQTSISGNSISQMSIDSATNKKGNVKLLWNKARTGEKQLFQFVEIPTSVEGRMLRLYNFPQDSVKVPPSENVLRHSFSRLVVYKNMSTGKENQTTITYYPDNEYLLAHNNIVSQNFLGKLDADFKGYLEYKDKNGKILYVLRVVNGLKKARYILGPFSKGRPQNIRINTLQEICIIPYEEGGHYNADGDYEQDHYSEGEEECFTYDDGDVPTPTNNNPPQETPGPDGTTGGQSTGNPESSANRNHNYLKFSWAQDIPDCLKNIGISVVSLASYDAVLQHLDQWDPNNNPYSNVADIIHGLANTNFPVSISAGQLTADANGNIPNAITQGHTDGIVYITVNEDYLSGASELAVARTLMHEMLHAYFVYAINYYTGYQADPNEAAEFAMINKDLFDKNGVPYVDQNAAQHEDIADRYVAQLGLLLEQYATDHKIASPNTQTLHDYCLDLAWGGLAGTHAYDKYCQNKQRVQNELEAEQLHNQYSTKPKACN